jgi:hypothetical protein
MVLSKSVKVNEYGVCNADTVCFCTVGTECLDIIQVYSLLSSERYFLYVFPVIVSKKRAHFPTLYLLTSQGLNSSLTYIYQKDERELSGSLQTN